LVSFSAFTHDLDVVPVLAVWGSASGFDGWFAALRAFTDWMISRDGYLCMSVFDFHSGRNSFISSIGMQKS